MKSKLNYLEVNDISHLITQHTNSYPYTEPLWRESYYFHVTDPNSKITLITTIGILPNKNRIMGFILLLQQGKVLYFKPIIEFSKKLFEENKFFVGALGYSVRSTNWEISFHSKKCKISLTFHPLNKIYQYIENEDNNRFERIGTQHYEQSGFFSGEIVLNNERIQFNNSAGHRDHSWGIRDWACIENYRLFCCTFSTNLSINLWEGIMNSKPFIKGYVFDGKKNLKVLKSKALTVYKKGSIEPKNVKLFLEDENKVKYEVNCEVVSSLPFPTKGSILFETSSKMRCNGQTSYGLVEYLNHITSRKRIPFILKGIKGLI